jgi:hypothetical protein
MVEAFPLTDPRVQGVAIGMTAKVTLYSIQTILARVGLQLLPLVLTILDPVLVMVDLLECDVHVVLPAGVKATVMQ